MGLRAMDVWQEYAENEAWAVFDKARQVFGCWHLEKPNPKKAQMRRWYAPGRRQEIHQLQWCQRWNWETDRPSSWCLGLRSWDFAIDFAFFSNETVVYLSRLRLVLPRWKRCGLILEPRLVVSCLRGSNKGIVNDPIILTIYATGAPDLTLIDLPVSHVYPWRAVIRKMMWRRSLRSYGEWDSSYFSYEPSTFCSHQPWFNDCSHEVFFFDFSMGSCGLESEIGCRLQLKTTICRFKDVSICSNNLRSMGTGSLSSRKLSQGDTRYDPPLHQRSTNDRPGCFFSCGLIRSFFSPSPKKPIEAPDFKGFSIFSMFIAKKKRTQAFKTLRVCCETFCISPLQTAHSLIYNKKYVSSWEI